MAEADDEGPAVRKEGLLLCFKEAVRDVFGFRYASDVDVRHGSKDRTLYFLVYGTREPAGIEVLRECQVKALEAQAEAASQRTQGKLVEDGIGFLFGTEWEHYSVNHRHFLERQRQNAREALLVLAANEPGLLWK